MAEIQVPIQASMKAMGQAAKLAADQLADDTSTQRTLALKIYADLLIRQSADIIAQNQQDLELAKQKNMTAALMDRLLLNPERVQAMAKSVQAVAAQADPLGKILAAWDRPNALQIERISVPLGVIGIIYEARPNVTADAAALCLRSGNAAILRCGSESFASSKLIHQIIQNALLQAKLPISAIQFVPTMDRAAVSEMLVMSEFIDLIIPRGGKSLVAKVQAESRVPILGHLEGLCHTYIDQAADPTMARKIVVNAKMRRTGICGATETLLVDQAALSMLPPILEDLLQAGCEIRGDLPTQKLNRKIMAATEEDWHTEYLAPIISVRVVAGVAGAIDHIRQYGTRHTEAIITEDQATADLFLRKVDAGIVMHNTSTQFADGGEFGMGAEIGISTGKLHARGPVGAEQLTSYKYLVHGKGQLRP